MLRTKRPQESPPARVEFRGVRLNKHAEPIDFAIEAGSTWAVVGPDPDAPLALLNTVSGKSKPHSGTVVAGPCVWSEAGPASRQTLQAWAKRISGPNSQTRIAEALLACGLWDERAKPLQRIAPEKWLRLGLFRLLLAKEAVLLAPHTLDFLDPWTLPGVLGALRHRCEEGATLLASTVRPDIVEKLGNVIVMKSGSVAFMGTADRLRDTASPVSVEIETSERDTARSIVAPFALEVRETEEGLVVRAHEGQGLAARLLLEGYGSVKAVVVRRPTVEEALLESTSRAVPRPREEVLVGRGRSPTRL